MIYPCDMAGLKVREIHALSGEILQLEEQLAAKKSKLNSLLGISEPKRKGRSRSVDGLRGKAIAWLNEHGDKDHSISEVSSGLGEDELVVGKALYNAYKNGMIENPGRGRYRALGILSKMEGKEVVLN